MENNQPSLWDQVDDKWLLFKEARNQVWTIGLEYREEWKLHIKNNYPDKSPLGYNIPSNPDEIYKYSGWKGWQDWLVPPESRKLYSPFKTAREFARCLRLKKKIDWDKYINNNIQFTKEYNLCLPVKPHYEYKDKGWIGWDDWLGKSIDYKTYVLTQKFVESLNLKSISAWRKYCVTNKPECIYAYPEIAYKGSEWKGWDEWLGINLFEKQNKGSFSDLLAGAIKCRCQGRDKDCIDCDGKGYYFEN